MKEYTNVCSVQQLWAAVPEEEAKAPKEEQVQGREHRVAKPWQKFWDKRSDGIVTGMAIDEGEKI